MTTESEVTIIAVVLGLTLLALALVVNDQLKSGDDSDVYEDLDRYGGYIYLSESSGSGNTLIKWYAAPESSISVGDGYLHVCKAATYSGYSLDSDVYIPLGQILYIRVNDH